MSVDSRDTVDQDVAAAPAGNPALIALPTFLVGGISLGLWLVGFLPRDLPGGLITAVVFVNGAGLWVSAIWAARIGQSAVAGIFGIFGGFWTSFGLLVFGLVNGLLGLSATDATLAASQVQATQATFLISWLIVFVVLTLATLRLPLAFTALFVFVDVAVALVLIGVLVGSTAALSLGGIAVFVFCAIGAYLFYDGMGQELGGRALPTGRPLQS
ncbi:GPR1/FUN34/YaaH family transporter [Pseudonocardia sp. GCM10023141]|uniref:GPR1/FUN34/YaaH family transporter n=1 Tax=Pseudonocardia sp. GCM10023141 TaxID=3252653 RepID=UPI0036100C83